METFLVDLDTETAKIHEIGRVSLTKTSDILASGSCRVSAILPSGYLCCPTRSVCYPSFRVPMQSYQSVCYPSFRVPMQSYQSVYYPSFRVPMQSYQSVCYPSFRVPMLSYQSVCYPSFRVPMLS